MNLASPLARTSVCVTRSSVAACMLVLFAGSAAALGQPAGEAKTPAKAVATGTAITIYSSAQPGAISPDTYRPAPASPYIYRQPQPIPGYAVVRENRLITLQAGVSDIRFSDVAALIDPTTVQFTSLTDPSTSVLEQNYQFDLVSGEKLLEKFIDKPITATVARGDKTEAVKGTLLSSANGQLVLQTPQGLEMLNGYVGLSFPELPEGLLTRPTLLWKVRGNPGSQTARVSYQTEGVTWWADYNLVYSEGKDANSGFLDVGAWVSIINQSGATYEDATLKLIAGDVQRAPRQNQPTPMRAEMMSKAGAAEDLGFAEKSFFEYHLYTLGRPATLPDRSTKQIELFPAAKHVPVEKILVYDALADLGWWGGDAPMTESSFGNQSKKDVDVYLRFVNSKDQGMGMPLPAGRIRVSKLDDADGSLEFIGEDVIRHTPRDEKVMVKLGRAFDVVGERTQTDYKLESARDQLEETIEIKVRNRKQEPVQVIVQEQMYRWLTWEIVKSNVEPKKLSTRVVHFPLTLKPGEEGVVRYTVKYTW